jgi:hypothetical protein
MSKNIDNKMRCTAMGVLRMIKLFGWESRVAKEIGEKRTEELKWVWKRKVSVRQLG